MEDPDQYQYQYQYDSSSGISAGVPVVIPIVNLVFMILALNALSRSFGQGSGFTVGLLFLGFIFLPILGFGSARYIGPDGVWRGGYGAYLPGFSPWDASSTGRRVPRPVSLR